MALARILTENKNYDDVVQLAAKEFEGATIIKAEGLWHGQTEHTLIIELVYDDVTERHCIEQFAFSIKKMNNQEAVLIQYIDCKSELM